MTIKEYYYFLRDVQKTHYPNSNLNMIKKMKNVKHAYECKKVEEVYKKCNNVNHFKESSRSIPKTQPTKKMKYIPNTPSTSITRFVPNMQFTKKMKYIPKTQPTQKMKY